MNFDESPGGGVSQFNSNYKTKKIKIKDVKAGDYALSLDESTGKLVPRKVNALLDHGIKPIYEMATESGRAINTTAEHPYYVKSSLLGIGDESKLPFSFNSIKSPSKSSGLDLSLSNFENVLNNTSGLSCGILSQTTENIFSLGNFEESAKCLSFVINTLCSDLENSANIPFESLFGLNSASIPCCLRNPNNSLLTFSSSRNFSFFSNTNDNIITSPGYDACIMQGCLDMLSSEGCYETCDYLFNRHATLKHFQNLPDHDSCALESRGASTNFAVSDNILINFDSHNINNDNSVYKTYENNNKNDKLGEWIEVRDLSVGMEIAVPDYSSNTIKWEKIASIRTLEPQHVYDLSIEGTRNFIANDIVAHNTYLATSSGNVGIGKTNPNYKLDVAGTINASGLLLENGTFSIGQGGSIGIGTNSPNSALVVVGNASFNRSTGGSAIFFDTTSNSILFNGENGSLYQPVYGSDDDLVLYLPFSENAINVSNKTYDRSPYGNDGTLYGMNYGNTTDELNNTGWAPGKYGNAIKFDGSNDYVVPGTGTSAGMNISSATITVGLWFKTANNQINKGLAGKWRTEESYVLQYGGAANANDVRFHVRINDVSYTGISPSTGLNDGKWHYAAGVYDGSNVRVYIDGVAGAPVAATGIIDTTPDELRIGDYAAANFFNGSIDEVMVYKRALTAEEIRTHYLRGSGFGASGAITADKFRVVNTSGTRKLELNQSGFGVYINASPSILVNKSGDINLGSTLLVDDKNNRVGIGTTTPTTLLEVQAAQASNPRITVSATDNSNVVSSIGVGNVDDSTTPVLNFGAPVGADGAGFAFFYRRTDGDLSILRRTGGTTFLTTPVLYLKRSDGNVGIGTASPQNALDVVGAVTVSKGLNASNLNVTGFSITDDSLVTLADGSRKKIKDIRVGEEVLTLEESSGKLVPRKVNALLDHGIKPIYEMATEDGRSINTTAEHPYFVRFGGNGLNPNEVSVNNLPLNSDGLTDLNKFINDENAVSISGGRILIKTMPEYFSGGNNKIFPKCLSNDKITLPSKLASLAISPSSDLKGAFLISKPASSNSLTTLSGTFSSEYSLNLLENDILFPFNQLRGIIQGREDSFFGEPRKVISNDFIWCNSSSQKIKDLPDHYSGIFESRLSMADFAVNDNKLVNFGSHNANNDNLVFKSYDNSARLQVNSF